MSLRPVLVAALIACLPALPLCAQEGSPTETEAMADPGALADRAAQDISAAQQRLERADSAADRVAALTNLLRAYEDGLAAMREGLRRVALREEAVERDLASRQAEISTLLGALQSMSDTPAPTLLLHPAGAVGTARSGMLIADLAPALQVRVTALQGTLSELHTLRVLQQDAADRLREGLDGVQAARTELSQAVSDRTDLPQRFTEDPVRTAMLVASAETLKAFSSGLTEIFEIDEAAEPDIISLEGELPLPAQGRILRRPGEADAAGVERPGLVLATRPGALVTAPLAATIRYRGPLLDYGNVMILEPQPGFLLVLAGMEIVYGEPGQVVRTGDPLGLMGGRDPDAGAIMAQAVDGAGNDRTETLYLEIRQGNEPRDPLLWFADSKDVQ